MSLPARELLRLLRHAILLTQVRDDNEGDDKCDAEKKSRGQ
jgi:hypothetical protein